MTQGSRSPVGFLTFTLHAHLPYVVNHGTWPHGMEWLHEAAAETYLPLLRVLRNLERDSIRFHCNLNLSPILLEQLAHPVFLAEFPKYLNRKIVAAAEDEAFFNQTGEPHYASLARFWGAFFADALADFQALDADLIGGFRHFNSTGLISLITCPATHGYLPLLGTDESVRAQIRTAVKVHTRHIGEAPRGIWSPECGYRPAGLWSYPVPEPDNAPAQPAFERIGLEQALAESNLDFFFIDTHLVEDSQLVPASPSSFDQHSQSTGQPLAPELSQPEPSQPDTPQTDTPQTDTPQTDTPQRIAPEPAANAGEPRSLYQPYFVDGPYQASADPKNGSSPARLAPVSIFPRDPRTGLQVWSGDTGYPGDSVYLDFHKKRWPGGHRYWRVTGPGIDMAYKQPYQPAEAAERVKDHAAHFTHLVWQALSTAATDNAAPPILCAPFDAELFGHWWFEGPMWLEAVARNLHQHETGITLTSCAEYLDRHPRADFLSLHEGSWGAAGNNQVWLNPETAWTWTHIYPAERFVRDLATAGRYQGSELGTRIAQQICRELLLLESSDWQFLITTGAARDYAESRFLTHSDQFNTLKILWQHFEANRHLTPEQTAQLNEINLRDGIFPDIDPSFWATGAHAS